KSAVNSALDGHGDRGHAHGTQRCSGHAAGKAHGDSIVGRSAEAVVTGVDAGRARVRRGTGEGSRRRAGGERVRPGRVRAVEDAHDPGLGGRVGGALRHLPVHVKKRAVDSEAERAEDEQAHPDNDEKERLTTLGTSSRPPQNVITPCVALPSLGAIGKYETNLSYG